MQPAVVVGVLHPGRPGLATVTGAQDQPERANQEALVGIGERRIEERRGQHVRRGRLRRPALHLLADLAGIGRAGALSIVLAQQLEQRAPIQHALPACAAVRAAQRDGVVPHGPDDTRAAELHRNQVGLHRTANLAPMRAAVDRQRNEAARTNSYQPLALPGHAASGSALVKLAWLDR